MAVVTQEDLLAEAKAKQKNPLNTPPQGWVVQWFKGGRRETPYAAIVTKVEGAGRVCLTIFGPNAHQVSKEACYHVDHPVLARKNSQDAARNGSWDYVPDTEVPKSHANLHLEELRRQITNIESNLLAQQRGKEADKKSKLQPAG